MNKKEIIVPFLVIGLTILFAGICVAVFLTNGKSKKWIARKIKIGGLLLSLTTISVGPGCITCYKPPPQNNLWFYNSDYGRLTVNLDSTNVLTGELYMPSFKNYIFEIENTTNNQIEQTGQLVPEDGKIDSDKEKVSIELDKDIEPGEYILNLFYTEDGTKQDNQVLDYTYLTITTSK